MSINSFNSQSLLKIGNQNYTIYRLDALPNIKKLPYTIKILLENLLRNEDGISVNKKHIQAISNWNPLFNDHLEMQFNPSRVIMQDFTGVPCIVDLATMREAVVEMGGNPDIVNPLLPTELVIDHSITLDFFGNSEAFKKNVALEYKRNAERYQFLKWGQNAFKNLKIIPPGAGIIHQVNIEYLAHTIITHENKVYPDTCVGTDSHTTMVNGLGILGWGVGGIEAEAAMLGQPIPMLIPKIVGVKVYGQIQVGVTATDVVLTITEMLRMHGVVGKFVEFYGKGLSNIKLADRATIGNMSPEFGSTVAIFPIDQETINYLKLTGRSEKQLALIKIYAKTQGMWHDTRYEPLYSEYLEFNLSSVVPSIAGPKRPQDRIPLKYSKEAFHKEIKEYSKSNVSSNFLKLNSKKNTTNFIKTLVNNLTYIHENNNDELIINHGSIVIAGITSCTNTSNPSVMLCAGLLARNAVKNNLTTKPWVKTNMAPGSKVVTDYYHKAGLWPYLEKLGYYLGGYGCTTCIGNTGPLPEKISKTINEKNLAVAAVLSGNRNYEGRISQDVKMNYLVSPPLVIAYGIAGTMNFDFITDPLGYDQKGKKIYLRDIWPSSNDIEKLTQLTVESKTFNSSYANLMSGDNYWRSLDVSEGSNFKWNNKSTYIRKAPYFKKMKFQPAAIKNIFNARVLVFLGNSVTTDHISPAGSIKPGTPASQYLDKCGIDIENYNSLGARRGNYEVMIRGTFSNIRLRNKLLENVLGGYTRDFTKSYGPQSFIYDASINYKKANIPLIVISGKEYGSGSSRDWAAKGTALLGIKAIIAESFERIHRSNLIGMGVIPLQFPLGVSASSLGLDGTETFDIIGLEDLNHNRELKTLKVVATKNYCNTIKFDAVIRIETPTEMKYYLNGGILNYVLRKLLNKS